MLEEIESAIGKGEERERETADERKWKGRLVIIRSSIRVTTSMLLRDPSISHAANGFSPVGLIAGKAGGVSWPPTIDMYTYRRSRLIFDVGPDGNGNYRDKRTLARYSLMS